MARSTIIILLMTLQVACGEVPRLFKEKDFTPASFAEAVNHFVSLGEEGAVEELKGLVPNSETYGRGFGVNERIGWMCRALFVAKPDLRLRPPEFGVLEDMPPRKMLEKNWPLFPVALSGSTYFVLEEGYIWIVGQSEDPKAYIEYCRKGGFFRKKLVAVPTKAQALKDFAALRKSAAWKSIKWTYIYEGTSATLSEEKILKSLRNQANSIQY